MLASILGLVTLDPHAKLLWSPESDDKALYSRTITQSRGIMQIMWRSGKSGMPHMCGMQGCWQRGYVGG